MGFTTNPLCLLLAAAVLLHAALVAALDSQQIIMSSRSNNDDDWSDSWHQYVRSPWNSIIKPRGVLHDRTRGNVSSPDGFITGTAPTVLSRAQTSEDKPSIVIDFGQNTVGLLEIQFSGSSTPNSAASALPGLRLAFSETLEFLTDRSDFTRSDHASGNAKLTDGTDQIAVKSAPYVWLAQSGCEHGNQVCSDGLHGFRYVKIWLEALDKDSPYTTSLGTVSISSVKLRFSAFLGTPDTFNGYFICSDPNITQWWYDAVYTNDLCIDVFRLNDTEPRNAGSPTLEGKLVLHDGPKRDRDPYVGDLAVSALTSYLTHDVGNATRNVLVDLAEHQRSDGWIPPASINNYTLPLFDYPLWWVVCSCDYAMYNRDDSFIPQVWPNLVKVLDTFYPSVTNKTTGLIERTDYGDYAFIPRQGPVTYYNALYVRALKYAARVAKDVGHDDDAARWRDRAELVGAALLKRNWDSEVGAFFDGGRCGSDEICPTHAQDGNSLAILAGITSVFDKSPIILDYLDSSMKRPWGNAFYDNDKVGDGYSQRVYAFISYFEMAARLESPVTWDSAIEELRRLYGTMSSGDPGLTFWEGIGPGGKPYQGGFTSMSHGWSTGIVPLMMNHVLGIKPTSVGFHSYLISPIIDVGGLTWAEGAFRLPIGGLSIWVRWEKIGKGSESQLRIESPDGTNGTVEMPVSSSGVRVELDDSVIYDGASKEPGQVGVFSATSSRDSRGRVSFAVGGGKHIVRVLAAT